MKFCSARPCRAALLVVVLFRFADGAFVQRKSLRASLRLVTNGRSATVTGNAGGNANAGASAGEGQRAVQAQAGSQTSAEATVQAIEAKIGVAMTEMLKEMLLGKGPAPQDLAKMMNSKMSFKDAVDRLDGRLPEEVASLVKMTSSDSAGAASDKSGKSQGRFDEDSLQKARNILNGMIVQAWKELDDVIFECKEFQERNRGTFEQVVGDIARLGSQLASLGDRRVAASEGIMEQDRMRKEAEETIQSTTSQFEQTRMVNDHEMSIRRNDLAVFDMILMMTACPDSSAASLAQIGSKKHQSNMTSQANQSKMHVCQHNGGMEIHFDDPKLQAKVERLMTPDARVALRQALGQVQVRKSKKSGLLQMSEIAEQPAANTTTPAMPTFAVETSPVSEEPDPAGQARKCVDGEVNCGLLHDLMSIEWGKFRDSFDELATEMKQNQDAFDKFMGSMNEQLTVVNDMRTKHMESLAETISSINADTEEMNEKDEQKRDLDAEYEKKMKEFRAACTEILFTRICGVRKVRNEILVDSTVSPPSKISDCDFTDWAPKDGICIGETGAAIDCDDTCPRPDPYACGGLETMKRDMVVAPNEYGMPCPVFERLKKCKQIKCPVDCVESEWSGWSKCSKECESGVRVRTRSILTKAKNGGRACDTVQEEEPCNTGSCDRDCTLDEWTEWTPCSMACGGGDQNRQKNVIIPIRGQGRCPRAKSADRFAEQACNTHDCVGDEICIARQDLVLLVDGSGSLREPGFETLRDFSANLTNRYQSMYYGQEDMKIGLVAFGNGHLETQPDGTTTITEAIWLQGLTSDLGAIHARITEMTWLRGFTNMAQGFHQADVMLAQTGRADAQSCVMVISDGKFSMHFQTAEKVRELKDKNIQVFLVAVTEVKGDDLRAYRQFASRPIATNFVRIPGLQALKYNADLFSQRIIAKFCPMAISPSQLAQKEEEVEYMMIHQSGYPSDSCGEWTWHGRGFNIDDCAAQAREDGRLAFAFGKGRLMSGGCYSEAIHVDDAFWNEVKTNRASPPCPGGTWVGNPYFDTYIIKPAVVPLDLSGQ